MSSARFEHVFVFIDMIDDYQLVHLSRIRGSAQMREGKFIAPVTGCFRCRRRKALGPSITERALLVLYDTNRLVRVRRETSGWSMG